MPRAIKPFRQPIPSSSKLTTGAASAGPSPHEAMISPMPTPRCRLNQYIADGIRGTRKMACATPSRTPKYRYNSQMVLISPVSNMPSRNIAVPTTIALRAPNRSPNQPAKGDANAVTTLEIAYASVMLPWLHWKVCSSGSIKTPNAMRMDVPTICITAMTVTMTQT